MERNGRANAWAPIHGLRANFLGFVNVCTPIFCDEIVAQHRRLPIQPWMIVPDSVTSTNVRLLLSLTKDFMANNTKEIRSRLGPFPVDISNSCFWHLAVAPLRPGVTAPRQTEVAGDL